MPDQSPQTRITVNDFLPLRNLDEDLSVYEEMSVADEQNFYEKITPERLVVEGHASFHEEVDAGKLIVEGRAVFADKVLCDSFLCNGEAIVKSKLICEEALIEGRTECYGRFHSDKVRISGELDLGGRMDAIDVEIPGICEAHGKVIADNVTVTGYARFKNLIRAINVMIEGNGSSIEATSINCENLFVKSGDVNLTDYILKCDSVFCDTVKIEYCEIDRILCEEAEIGEGCHVRLLECHEEPVIGFDSIVENIVHV